MEAIKVDVSNPNLCKPPEFPVLFPGIHLFAAAKIGEPEPAKEGPNLVISCEFRCQDEDKNKGLVVFERFILIDPSNQTEKAAKGRKINQQSMTTFCLACGVTTKEEVAATGELPLMKCRDAFFKAETGVQNNTYQGQTRKQSFIKKYLFEENTESSGGE